MNSKFILLAVISAFTLAAKAYPGKLSPQFRNDYTYFEKTKQFLKLHVEERTIYHARITCEQEESELAFWDSPEKQLSFTSISMNNSVWIGAYIQNAMLYSSNGKNIDELTLQYPLPVHTFSNNYDTVIRICMISSDIVKNCPEKMSFICSKTLNPSVEYALMNNSVPFFRNDYTYNEQIGYAIKLHNPLLWHEAIEMCEQEGAELLTIDDDNDVQELFSLLELNPGGQVWVGASDLLVESKYETLRGEPLKKIINITYGHCVAINDAGLYESISCEESVMFFCQKRFETYNFECDTVDIKYKKISGNGKCVKYHMVPKTWHEALEICKVENATLFIINHEREAAILSEKLTKIEKLGAGKNYFDHSILHVGFHDLFIEGMYRTVNGDLLKDSGYEIWSSFYPKPYMDQRCGGMVKGGTLQNGACDVPALFACQKKANSYFVK